MVELGLNLLQNHLHDVIYEILPFKSKLIDDLDE